MQRILIIEDKKELREEISENLAFEGFDVIQTDNGRVGIELAVTQKPDIILCDIMIPGLNGNQVLKALKQTDSTKLIPFIFMTALTDRDDIRKGMESGADDYLTKPFTIKELFQTIRARLDKSTDILQSSEKDMKELRQNIISNIPHELLTPLNGIIGYSELIKNSADGLGIDELKEMGNDINVSGKRLLSLIRKYLIYIQVTAKSKSDFNKTAIKESSEIITQIAQDIAAKYSREKYLVLKLEKLTFNMGVEEFKTVISEITDNAFKFSNPDTKVTISSSVQNGFNEIQFTDNGIGFPEGSAEKIDAFVQFGRQINEQQGSGLGLAISKKIISIYDGLFFIENNNEQGSTISIAFTS